uniref:Uncharacterized protein n=1 Tax=Amphimedon queenslandica TaxID=400682 RepID=A0A1X7U4C7_AMPQE
MPTCTSSLVPGVDYLLLVVLSSSLY